MPRARTRSSTAPAANTSAPAELVETPVRVEPPQPPQHEPHHEPTPAPKSKAASAPAAADGPDLAPTLEALLLSTDKPLAIPRLAQALALVNEEAEEAPDDAADRIRAAITALNQQYETTARAFRIELVAGGYRVMTRPQFAQAVARLHRSRADAKLSRAALETLAIVAYRQPITRADLEAIRGVACGEVLRSLMERRLVTITGRAEELGRPMLYGTTKQFLEGFGLATLKDLPTLTELKAP